MKQNELINFFSIQRQIFGQCPHSKQLFRLSDCNIYLKGKRHLDWKDRIDRANEKLSEQECQLRKDANIIGRDLARKIVRKIDLIFCPQKLNHHDAFAIFNPVDYIIFNGMQKCDYKNIIIMDGKKKSQEMKKIQKSISSVIEKEKYEWITFRVKEDGTIDQE